MLNNSNRKCLLGVALIVCANALWAQTVTNSPLMSVRQALRDELHPLAEKQVRHYLSTQSAPEADHSARALLAEALYGQKAYTKVLELLESEDRKVKVLPAPDGSSVYWRAMARFGLQQFDGVGDYLAEFEKTYPTSPYTPRVLRLRGMSLNREGKLPDAIAVFRDYDKRYPEASPSDRAENLLSLGLALIAADDSKAAESVLKRLRDNHGMNVAAQKGTYWLAESMVHQKRWDEAESLLLALGGQVDARKDLRTDAWYALADVYQSREKFNPAIHALTQGIELAEDVERARVGRLILGQLLVRLNRLKEGVPLLKAFIAVAPGDPNAGPLQLYLSRQLLEHDDYVQAVEEFQHYLESFKDPVGIAEASYGKAWGLYKLERYAESATAFQKAYELFGEGRRKEESLFKTADAYFKNAQYELAYQTYEKLSGTYTNSALVVQSLYQMGECYVERNQFPEALKQFTQISELYSTNRFAEKSLLRIATTAKEQGDPDAALKGFDVVIQRFTNGQYRSEALLQRGELRWQKIDFEGALADFRAVVTDYPDSEQAQSAYYWQGVCKYYSGKEAEAIRIWEAYVEAYASSPDVPNVLYWVGQHEYNQKLYAETEKRMLGIEANYPDHTLADDALYLAARSASKQGDFSGANEHFTALVKTYPKSNRLAETRFFQAENFRELFKYTAAIVLYDNIILNHPDSFLVDRAWLRKGTCHFMAGVQDAQEYKNAIDAYQHVLDSRDASLGMKYQSEHGIGLCYGKMDRDKDAFEQYYKVISGFEKAHNAGIRHSDVSELWFTRAVLAAAKFQEQQKNWRQAVKLYQHLVDAQVPAEEDARTRIDNIRSEHWLLF